MQVEIDHFWWQKKLLDMYYLITNLVVYFRFVVVQSAGKENSGEKHLHDDSTVHENGGHDSSFSDSDEEEETQGIVTGIH